MGRGGAPARVELGGYELFSVVSLKKIISSVRQVELEGRVLVVGRVCLFLDWGRVGGGI